MIRLTPWRLAAMESRSGSGGLGLLEAQIAWFGQPANVPNTSGRAEREHQCTGTDGRAPRHRGVAAGVQGAV